MSKYNHFESKCRRGCKPQKCYCKPKKCKRRIVWPPDNPDEEQNHVHAPTHIYVPGTFKNFDQAVAAVDWVQNVHDQVPGYDPDESCDYSERISYNPMGYVIHLAPTQDHVGSIDMSNDVSYLRVEGDVSPVKGVGYFHGLANWGDYTDFSEEYNVCIGGAGVFSLNVDCDTITVEGCPSPNYNSLKCGDKLTFFHKNGKTTKHTVKCAEDNSITVYDSIPICKCVQMGEGFVIRPNVNLKMCPKNGCKNQKFQIEHRMEFAGLNLTLNSRLIWGANAGHTDLSYSVVDGKCGSLVQVGKMDWNVPNTFLTNMTINSGSHGTAMLQTFVGCNANLVAQSNPPTQFWFGVFVRNQTSVNLINDAHIDTFSSDFYGSATASHVQAGSKHAISKCRFIDCAVGTYAEQNSHFSALPMFGTSENNINDMAVQFINNELAIKLDTNSHHAMEKIYVVGNTVDLEIDGVIYADINTYASASTGVKNSVSYYSIALTVIVPP